MQEQKNLEAIMGLIMFGGNAKSDCCSEKRRF